MKFHRLYQLTVQTFDKQDNIIIEPPFTIQFNIERSAMASINSMDLRLYNLKPETRNRLQHDRFRFDVYQKIELRAGYGGDLPLIFSGNIFQANSYREGSNIVTCIDARDGAFDTTTQRTFTTLQQGTTVKEAVTTLIKQFPNLQIGKIGDIQGTPARPIVLDGNTYDLIKRYTAGSNFVPFIDLGKVNVLDGKEVITGFLPVLDADSGLLETPRRDDGFLTVTTLFEPRVIVGQIIKLVSTIQNPVYNGDYKVIGVNHQGVISEAVSGHCRSSFALLLGNQFYGAYSHL